ncbi:hypothetical protein VHEMI05086 [[Torrubiella] hemipterigena]|uniref:Protein kinase domain-containing protein n=1 Tax=[Torrubiella] hemipterigena TaxID=1531966 RepID=A0A0A1SX33_9HYPO|nr:hypothetical protein VHEMI05086 [[Torrubiella] hemipterigena]
MERHIFQTLEAKGFTWFSHYRGASLTFDNPIKYPFLVLEWIEGSSSQPIRGTLLAQIAQIQLSLISSTLEERSITASAFFQRRIRNQLNRTRCRLFAMDHGDMKPANIIVDEEYHVKYIIDWDLRQWFLSLKRRSCHVFCGRMRQQVTPQAEACSRIDNYTSGPFPHKIRKQL